MITFPTSPSVNQTFTSAGAVWTWDGVKWKPSTYVSPSLSIADTPPASPIAGALWYDSVGGELYVYYNNAWVTAVNIAAPPSTTPIGTTTQIAFNNAGVESGDANLVWNAATTTLTANGTVSSNYVSANGSVGLAGQVLTSGGAGANTVWSNSTLAYRNRIINGDMKIDQRNGGVSGTATQYTVDRWFYGGTQASKGTWGRNLNAIAGPAGFPYYLGFQSSSSYSVLTADNWSIWQAIEADAISDFQWGTANAQPVTLSFWVYSSLGGATPFSGVIKNYAATRSYPFTYSIPVANVWTKITLTIPGDTTGTWVMSGNGLGSLYVQFDLGAGATYRGTAGSWTTGNLCGVTGTVSVVGTNAATWYVTGVQLELGSVATPFERLPPQVSMALCQRYCNTGGPAYAVLYGTAGLPVMVNGCFPVQMRATPTMSIARSGLINLTGVFNGAISSTGFYDYGVINATGEAQYVITWTAYAEL